MRRERLQGVFTALVTPFDAHGGLDESAIRGLARAQIAAGVAGMVPAGTTGEGATLSDAEHRRLVEIVVEEAAMAPPPRKVWVFAGAGSNDTRQACALGVSARSAGADGLLVVTPYYNKPTQAGLKAHFVAVAEAAELPVLLYNVPGRTGVNLLPETVLALAEREEFWGVKEASGQLDQVSRILASRPASFAVLAGDDALALPVVALGGDGVVSVASNAAPAQMVDLLDAALAGERARAVALYRRLAPLLHANFVEPNPIPVKWALWRLGFLADRLRLPLQSATLSTRRTMTEALERAGLLVDSAASGAETAA
ncbi:MAG: 4-hydroxy-tetrahydrodipicolinate synthase [Acidobacteriota bacterium]